MKRVELINLLYLLLPLIVVGYFYAKWVGKRGEILYATFRMVTQLILIGYLLDYIFNNSYSFLTLLVILIMVTSASFIAFRNISKRDLNLLKYILISIFIGGTINLILVIYFVLDVNSLNEPRFIIPIAGMVYANSMNAISLVAERLEKELVNKNFFEARANAFRAALIPQINAFLAVGLVSLPGMMTGQILSGINPLIAIKYQIMVMLMVLGSSGISIIIYLSFQKRLNRTS